jgi:hypothetical protein
MYAMNYAVLRIILIACLLPGGALLAQAPQPKLGRTTIRQASAILREMRDSAIRMPARKEDESGTGSFREDSLLNIVNLYQDIGDPKSARETIALIKAGSTRNFAWCMIALDMSLHGKPTKRLAIAKAIPDSDDRERCFKNIADFQVEEANIGSAAIMETISLVADPSVRVLLLGQLAVRQAKAGKQREAVELFQSATATTREMNDQMGKFQLLAEIALDHAKAGSNDDARQMFLQLRREVVSLVVSTFSAVPKPGTHSSQSKPPFPLYPDRRQRLE